MSQPANTLQPVRTALRLRFLEATWLNLPVTKNRTTPAFALCLLAGIWLAFLLFGEDILSLRVLGRPMIGAPYRAGASIIPPVMFAYILSGIAEGLMASVYLRGRSGIVPAATSDMKATIGVTATEDGSPIGVISSTTKSLQERER